MNRAENYYLAFEFFLDPPPTDWREVEKHIDEKKNEWNKKRNNPNGLIYKQLSEQVETMRATLRDVGVRRSQAEEARRLKLAEFERRVASCSDETIAPEQVERLVGEFKAFFAEETLRAQIRIPIKEAEPIRRALDPPQEPKRDPSIPNFDSKMKPLANDLRVLGAPTLYLALRLTPKTSLERLNEASLEAIDRAQRAGSKTAKIDAQKELGQMAREFFKDERSKEGFDASWARFQAKEKLESRFQDRIVSRKENGKNENSVSRRFYERSLKDALEEGLAPEFAAWFVYNFYVERRKCPDPRVVEEKSLFASSISCPNCFRQNDKNSNCCFHCGYALQTTCPQCERRCSVVDFCPHCGFSFVDMTNSNLHTLDARVALGKSELDDALFSWRRARAFWAENPDLPTLLNELRDRIAERNYDAFEKMFASGKISEARSILDKLSFDGRDSSFIAVKRSLGEKLLDENKAREIGLASIERTFQAKRFFEAEEKLDELIGKLGASTAFELKRAKIRAAQKDVLAEAAEASKVANVEERETLLAALASKYPDCREIGALLDSLPLEPPKRVESVPTSEGIEVRWTPSRSRGIVYYRVARVELTPGKDLRSLETVLCEKTEKTSFLDTSAEEFKSYVYLTTPFRETNGDKGASVESNVAFRVGKLRNLVASSRSNALRVSWDVSKNAQGVEVRRRDASSLDDAFVAISDVGASGFEDVGLINGTEYRYALSIRYVDSSGAPRQTRVQYVSGVPDVPPTALSQLRAQYWEGRIRLVWDLPTKGVSYFFLSFKPSGKRYGEVVSATLDELTRLLGDVATIKDYATKGGRACGFVDLPSDGRSGALYILPATVYGRNVVFGRETSVAILEPVKGLKSQLVDDDVYISWDWAPGIKEVLILYSERFLPCDVDEQKCGRVVLSKKEYDVASAWRRLGQGETPLYVAIFQRVELEGRVAYSLPARLCTEKFYIAYVKRKRLFLGKTSSDSKRGRALRRWGLWNVLARFLPTREEYALIFRPLGGRKKTPRIAVVKRADRAPLRRDDGETVAIIPASNEGAFEFNLDRFVSPNAFFSCFCADSSDVGLFALIDES